MAKGKIVEQGTHDELIAAQGIYQSLVQAQELSSKTQPDNRVSEVPSIEKQDATTDVEKLGLTRTVTSKAATITEAKEEAKDDEYSNWQLVKFSWELNRGEQVQMMIGFLFCIGAGAGPAIQAIFLGNSINSFLSPQTSTGGHGLSFWLWMFFMLGFVVFIMYLGQGLTLSKASAQLVARIREEAFGAILRQVTF